MYMVNSLRVSSSIKSIFNLHENVNWSVQEKFRTDDGSIRTPLINAHNVGAFLEELARLLSSLIALSGSISFVRKTSFYYDLDNCTLAPATLNGANTLEMMH
uniref:Uncharacterized protein n=1 Tax=Romanomermis culicivorax TaxID=13658 RepID=A0A915KDY3_ROMCU